ncbi:hypothetical protein DE146DRAFT_435045 [Phaeosphaeria sp. MPI-PUGE-AT-0046c]|nr:hypothetical protein DE146DRAFT_435045 [Phaeosphaeria sp. MPI-PUGE-AT-0046c]
MFEEGDPATSSMDGPIELSDSGEMQSSNDDASVELDANNRRLAQAVNYMQQEGGNDSYMTFMDRVKRIHEALVKQLQLHGQNFDLRLYQQLHTLVTQAKQEYTEAIQGSWSRMEIDEDSLVDCAPPSFEEALERGGSEPASPTPAPTRKAPIRKALNPRRGERDDNVERVRNFKYGGPNNEPENWHKDFPGILPFPETFLMAHWESLKIDYDLARPKDSNTVETNVPLNHPSLKKYFNLPLYESGSRFKLPLVREELQKEVSRYGTDDHLRRAVDDFYDPDTSYDDADYAPRVFLEKFTVGTQMPPNTVSPSQVRRALASTPTQPRSSILRKASFSDAGPSSRAKNTPRSTTRTSQPVDRASPAFRRISGMVRATQAEEARIEQATAAKLSSSKPTSTTKVASHVAVSPKRGPGRPTKRIEPAANKVTPRMAFEAAIGRQRAVSGSTPYTLPSELPVTPTTQPSKAKRKASIGSQPYAEPTQNLERPIKRVRITPGKTVNFAQPLDEESESAEEVYETTSSSKKGKATAKGKGKAPVRNQPVKTVTETTSGKGKITKKTSKAAAAGKAIKNRDQAKKQVGIAAEQAGSTTRSGASYTI